MFDFDGFARLLDRILGRTRARSQAWVAVWLAGILVVTAIAAISSAPTGAYVILVIVAGVAFFADGQSGDPL